MSAFAALPPYAALGPQAKNLCRSVRRFVQHDLAADLCGPVLLAVSGGADSLALLILFHYLSPLWSADLHVTHVLHGLRPEGEAEARSVAELCSALGIACTGLHADVRTHAVSAGLGLEEAARELRYARLEEARQQCGARWICTGHQRGDLEEDILMRLSRGTGWPGLAGMRAVDARRRLLRPLLLTEPQDLRDLLTHVGVTWAEDQSNADTGYTRNRMRHVLLPLVHEENPAFGCAATLLWRLGQDDAEYWQGEVQRLCAEHGARFAEAEVVLPASLLATAPRALRLRVYMKAVHHLNAGQARAETLRQLDAALQEGRGGTVFQLPGKVTAHVRRGAVIFQRP